MMPHYKCVLALASVVNYDHKQMSQFEASLTDDSRVIIYGRNMFIHDIAV